MTPSQQQWMFDNDKSETIDEESTTSSPSALVKKQTNPYGYLKNEFSEESSAEERGICLRFFSKQVFILWQPNHNNIIIIFIKIFFIFKIITLPH